ncbi:TIGR02680 family protein [Nitriliruptoraceae bacterium ZYF776]|nr:TIGR02680 family protein [Profundirhabdus halotolerans]
MTVAGEPSPPTVTDRGDPRLGGPPDRWRPERAGVVNVWQYAEETLEFADGRLLLYGANGSGKTMLLELLLPYLLDARGQPGRLSTAGADRGGLWDRVTGYGASEGRTGFLWVTFVRTGSDGEVDRFTCGTRLRAKPSGGGEHTWFTTSLAPTRDLHLLDDQRRPVAVDELAARLGTHGTVWGNDTDGYRGAVRGTLYPGFSAEQLDACITALLVARKQSVTDGLSADRLHELLSAGLPALDDQEVAKVARGFEELDRRRDDIERMTADLRVVDRVATTARAHARAVLAVQAADRIAAETAKDRVTRVEREARDRHAAAADEVDDLTARADAADDRGRRLAARREALLTSDAYREAGRLDDLGRAAEQARGRADEAGTRADRARARSEEAEAKLQRDREEVHRTDEQRRRLADELDDALTVAGTPSRIGAVTDAGGTAVDRAPDGDGDAAEVVAAELAGRTHQLKEVRQRLLEHRDAVRDRERSLEHHDEADGRLRERRAELRTAAREVDGQLEAWRAELGGWVAHLQELPADVAAPVEQASAPDEVARTVRAAREAVVRPLLIDDAELAAHAGELADQEQRLDRELVAVEAGEDLVPDGPAWREERTGIPGAPFRLLVDLAPGLDETAAGRIEAALLATGLLDAWVRPDGRLDSDRADLGLLADAPIVDGPSLADVLRPESDTGPAGDVAATVLRRVALVDERADRAALPTVVVGRDGTFRAGPLAGRGPTGPARYLGATARRRHRERRTTELRDAIAGVAAERAEVEDRRRAVAGRIERADAEVVAQPSGTAVDQARRFHETAQVQLDAAVAEIGRAETAVRDAERRVESSLRQLSLLADRHGLPTDDDGLERVAAAVADATARLRTYRGHLALLASLRVRLLEREDEVADVQRQAADEHRRATELGGEAVTAVERFATLERVAGAEARQVREQLGAVEAELVTLERDQREIGRDLATVREELGRAEAVLSQATADRERADQVRDDVHERLRAAVRDGLIEDAGRDPVPTPANVTASLELARGIGGREEPPTPAEVSRALGRLRDAVREATEQLGGRADLQVVDGDLWASLHARVDGLTHRAPQLRQRFGELLERARTELGTREERVFEETLTGAVRRHLADRIRTATATVTAMNTLLAAVETSAGGVRSQLRWDVDADEVDDREVLRRIRTLLLGSHHDPAEQRELHEFLRRQIALVRADEQDTGSWHERLSRVLDYRRWHRFEVLVHHRRFGDTPVRFGSRKVQLSAGERTVALTVPLIAAIAAHYLPRDGAEPPPPCPRLLLMDELFPKVDRANKRLLLGMINDLGLDVVFTSDKDWCDYDTLDRIAIHVVQKDGDRSLTTRFVWEAGARQPAPVSAVSVVAADDHGPSLFDGA